MKILRNYQKDCNLIVMITNHSGINRGSYGISDIERFNTALESELKSRAITLSADYYSPHRPDENCDSRKPKTGLVEKACRE